MNGRKSRSRVSYVLGLDRIEPSDCLWWMDLSQPHVVAMRCDPLDFLIGPYLICRIHISALALCSVGMVGLDFERLLPP